MSENKPYKVRIDQVRLNEGANVLEYHDADNDRWIVIGWLDFEMRQNARNRTGGLSEEIARWNEELADDLYGLGHIHTL